MSDTDDVKLKPFLGMKPGKYLVILYTAIIIIVFFLLLILPGLISPGTQYNFDSIPGNAVVYIDDSYVGATPCKAFVPAGTHIIRIEKKHFINFSQEIQTGSRIFGSLFIKKKQDFSTEIVLNDPDGFMSDSFREFASWGMIDTYYENYQPKPVLGPLFNDLKDAGYADVPELSAFLYSAIPFVHNEVLYNDFLDAVLIFQELKTGSPADVSPDITKSFTELEFFQDTAKFTENLPFWFYSILSEETRGDKLSWYPAMENEYGGFLRDFNNDFPSAKAAVTVNGMRFVMLSGGQFLMGADGASFPYPAAVDDMFIMDREVTNELFKLFLLENTKWMPENIDNLIDEGLVNQDYLKDFSSSSDTAPVNFVSWYAAEAFCDWLQQKLPDYLSDYKVRLPDEQEWEWAASTDPQDSGIFKKSSSNGPLSIDGRYPNNSGMYDLKGNLWEWCDNWYTPAAGLLTSKNPAYNDAYYGRYPGIEKSVRGGSWANDDDISTSSRGSQPPQWCTEFLGFRPVIVKE